MNGGDCNIRISIMSLANLYEQGKTWDRLIIGQ